MSIFQYHWSFWIFILLGIIFLMWLFFGGKEQEFVGLGPLLPSKEESLDPIVITTVDPPILDEICLTSVDPPYLTYDDDNIPDVPLPLKPSRWKRQERCCRAAEEIFGRPFRRDVRDLDWLYNPETGANLELDCYNEELGIAIEHNGEHHYKFPNHWNKTREEWIAMVRRDRIKPELCDRNGVYLITIPYSIPFESIKQTIRDQLKPLLQM